MFSDQAAVTAAKIGRSYPLGCASPSLNPHEALTKTTGGYMSAVTEAAVFRGSSEFSLVKFDMIKENEY